MTVCHYNVLLTGQECPVSRLVENVAQMQVDLAFELHAPYSWDSVPDSPNTFLHAIQHHLLRLAQVFELGWRLFENREEAFLIVQLDLIIRTHAEGDFTVQRTRPDRHSNNYI